MNAKQLLDRLQQESHQWVFHQGRDEKARHLPKGIALSESERDRLVALLSAAQVWKRARDRYYSDPRVTSQEYGEAAENLAWLVEPPSLPRCTLCGHERWTDDQGRCGELEIDSASEHEGLATRCGCKCVFNTATNE